MKTKDTWMCGCGRCYSRLDGCAVYNSALADTYVNGYYRGNGTYVNPHFRSAPNSVQSDNYGSWYSKSYRDRPVAPVQQTECEPYFNGYTYTIRCN